MTTWEFTVDQLKWYDNNRWWMGIIAGDNTTFADVTVNDYIVVKDSSGNVVVEGTVYKRKESDITILWLRSNNYDYLIGKDVKVASGVASYEIDKSATSMVDEARATIPVIDDFGLDIGDDVDVWVGNRVMISGFVRHKDSEDYGRKTLHIVSYGDVLLRTYVQEVLYDMDVADIVKYLVERYTDLTVDTITTGVKIPRLMAKDYLAQIIQRLADVVGYQFRTVGKTLYFKPIAYDSASTVLDGTNCRFSGWKIFTDRLVNEVYIVGGTLTFEQTDTFTGDGTTTEFQLTYRPKGDILVKVDGVVQIRDKDYTIDEDAGKVIFVTAPASGSTIEVKYSYEVSIFLSARDDASIKKYGLFDRKERMVWIKDFDTAKNVARSILRMFSKPEISVTAKMPLGTFINTDIDVGKNIRCVDDTENIDEYLIVKSLKLKNGYVDLDLGTHIVTLYEWSAKIQERVRMLELEHLGEDVLTKYYAFIESIKAKVKETTFRIKTQNIIDGFRLGRSELGVKYLGDKRQGWNVYVEVVVA